MSVRSESGIKKELKKIEAMKKSRKYETYWDYLGGVQQALCWALKDNAMRPARLCVLNKPPEAR